MKLILILLFLTNICFSQKTRVYKIAYPHNLLNKVYYLSDSGNDSNTGLDSSHTWLTINKLTSAGLKPGDTVRFKGGDTLTGAASVYTEFTNYWPSKKIVFNSYGSGKATLRNLNNALCISIGYTNVTKFEIRNLIFSGNYDAVTQSGGATNSKGLIFAYSGFGTANRQGMYIKIDSCEFTRYYAAGIDITTSIYHRGTYEITSNRVSNMGQSGIHLTNVFNSNTILRNNEVTNIFGRTVSDYCTGFEFNNCLGVLVENNYVNNIGVYSPIGGMGIYADYSSQFIMRRNEVRNVYGATGEGIGLYADCGTDSTLFEKNYIQNCRIGINLANAPKSFCLGGTDSLEASYNIARFNIIVGDSASFAGILMYAGYGSNTTFQKRNMIYNNLIYMTGGYRYIDTSVGRILPTCIYQYGRSDSLYIYNNVFMMDSGTAITHDIPTPGTLHGEIKNWIVKNNIYWHINGLDNAIGRQRKNQFNSSPFFWRYKTYSSISNWADSTGLEKNGLTYTYFNQDPLINNPTMRIYGTSAKINPYYFDTLSSFKSSVSSITKDNGVNFNSEVIRIADTITTDFYNNTYINDIGIYQQ